MQNVISALHRCRAVKFGSCNSLWSSVYTVLVNHAEKRNSIVCFIVIFIIIIIIIITTRPTISIGPASGILFVSAWFAAFNIDEICHQHRKLRMLCMVKMNVHQSFVKWHFVALSTVTITTCIKLRQLLLKQYCLPQAFSVVCISAENSTF